MQVGGTTAFLLLLDARHLLQCVATLRGWFGVGKVPNEARAARDVLKAYVTGSLLYCHPPPSLSAEDRQTFLESSSDMDVLIIVCFSCLLTISWILS